MKRGDRLIAFEDSRLKERLFIEVNRVARDGSWADISVCNAMVMWKKRQPLKEGRLPYAAPLDWSQQDIDATLSDWYAE